MKRAAPAETHYLERDEMAGLLRHLPRTGRLAQRDHALILFLYNTGARAQEVAELRAGNLQLVEPYLVRLHGKGDKWRTCPLWDQTAKLLTALLDSPGEPPAANAPVFCSATGEALTRFGIYKAVRRLAGHLDDPGTNRTVSPHVFRHYRSGAPPGIRGRNQRHPRLARPRRSDHDESLRRNQHQDKNGSPAGHRAVRYFGGTPPYPRLEVRRITAQLALKPLMVMWPKSTQPCRHGRVTVIRAT